MAHRASAVSDRIEALRRAVAGSPGDPALRLLLAEELVDGGQPDAALQEYGTLLQAGDLPGDAAVRAGNLALDVGDDISLARAFAVIARERGAVSGVSGLERRIEEALLSRGWERAPVSGVVDPDALIEIPDRLTFDDVGGSDDVKKVIHRRVVLPESRRDLLRRYGRRAGGGVLLYGPPGCGKTLLARATAGECRAPFLNVRIEAILDPFHGVSERNLHAAFEAARARTPSVLFIDELDALGYARRKHRDGAPGRSLVDVLLQELDAIGADNEGVLVLASTNAPWDVDDALLRPGRFDHRIFVPPPDSEARAAILGLLLEDVPHDDDLDLRAVVDATELFSGADLREAVDRAIDAVIDQALETGSERLLTGHDVRHAVSSMSPTTIDWLQIARSYVEFANVGERYGDVERFLGSRTVRRRLGR